MLPRIHGSAASRRREPHRFFDRSLWPDFQIAQITGFARPKREFLGKLAEEGVGTDAEIQVMGHAGDQPFDPESPVVAEGGFQTG